VERAAIGWAEMQTATQLTVAAAIAAADTAPTIERVAKVRMALANLLVDEHLPTAAGDWDSALAELTRGGE
jgi:hypothetical protein